VPERILVTGGAGFVGSHLVDALLSQGHAVRVLDTLETQVHSSAGSPPQYLNPAAEAIWGSVGDRAVLARALDGIDVVFHQAALVGVGQSMYEIARYVTGNTGATAVLLEEIIKRRDRIRKVVVASSMSIYGEGAYRSRDGADRFPRLRGRDQLARADWEVRDSATQEALRPIPTAETKPLFPTSVYAITKRDHEELCLSIGYAYKIPTIALRYFNIYGDRQSLSNPYTGVAAIFSSRLLNGHAPVIFEDGAQSRDFVHVSDIVQANLLCLATDRADYEALNVGTGQPTTVLQVAELIAEYLGRGDLKPEITSRFREGDIRHCIADVSRARSLLGYQPKVAFKDGLRQLIGWVRGERPEDRFEQAHQELVARGLA
jgi:dTDP-L-rhamnose 4-epimerase